MCIRDRFKAALKSLTPHLWRINDLGHFVFLNRAGFINCRSIIRILHQLGILIHCRLGYWKDIIFICIKSLTSVWSWNYGIHPVSYTHLDVYKRQPFSRTPGDGSCSARMTTEGCSTPSPSNVHRACNLPTAFSPDAAMASRAVVSPVA